MSFHVQGLDHIALTVGDQQISDSWYRDVLGLERKHADAWGDTPIALMAHGSGLALFKAPAPDGNRAAGLRHIAFRVDRENFELAQDDLRGRGIAFEFQDHVVSQSIYFEDPDGLLLELTTYEV
jgi:catechol 2,3-dioxygenase-like lactoylglutathione lyase family enzyme